MDRYGKARAAQDFTIDATPEKEPSLSESFHQKVPWNSWNTNDGVILVMNINNIFEWLCYDLLMLICWIFLLLSLFFIHYHCFYCIWLLIWWILHMGVWVDIDPMPGFRMYTLSIEKTCSAISLSCLSPGFWSWLLIPLLGSFIFIGRSSFMEKFQWSCQNFSCIWLAIDDLIHPTGAQASVDALIGCGTALSRSKALVFRKFQYHALKNMDQRWIQEQKLEATKLARR